MNLPEIVGNKFLYFGYGSNMLSKRILLNNKSAVKKTCGKLQDHEFTFFLSSTRWKGSPATIVPKPGSHVMGVIWEIDVSNLDDLDRQESVSEGVYKPLSMPINTLNGETITCRVYQLRELPESFPHISTRLPSYSYLKTIVKGAEENGIPEIYIKFLKSFEHNGEIVDEFEKQLEIEHYNLK